jgi:hypothetical protein
MKLTARQKYDYRDLNRGEAQLIRIGHALWRDRRKLGDTVAEREGINAALESVWQAKREYRAELTEKRAVRFSRYRDTLNSSEFVKASVGSGQNDNVEATLRT